MASRSNLNSSQQGKCTLRVIGAELTEPLKKGMIYVEIKLPRGLQVFTQTVESTKLIWNRKFDFTSIHTASIHIKLKKRDNLRSDVCLGEASVSIENLNNQCRMGQEYSLTLQNLGRKQAIGTLGLHLQSKANTPHSSSRIANSRQMVENTRSKLVETISMEYSDRSRGPSVSQRTAATVKTSEESDDFEPLNRVHRRLGSMKSGKLKTSLDVIDTAARIHPFVESSWKIVSSLHRVSQKKARMDSGVIELFTTMDHILSFVENVDALKEKQEWFLDLIKESLGMIEECGSFILRYLGANAAGQSWAAFSREEELRDYHSQLKDIAGKLDSVISVHTTQRLENNHDEVIKALGRIDLKVTNPHPPPATYFQPIIPPPPTEIFTGRDRYLKIMEESFELPQTSIELGKQRRFVLYGSGGMGKTQLVLKFSELHRERFPIQYIIDASSHATVAAGFASIARHAGIPDTDTNLVLDWLSKKAEDWILIFDNADDRDVILRSFFPRSHHGNILITTRNADYGSLAASLEVSVLEEPNAVSLLLKSGKLQETEQIQHMALKLVRKFGCLALAVVQAGSYMHTERLGLSEYFELYQRSRSSLLKSGPLKQELAYEQPVYATWEISYGGLTVFAKSILDISSFFYREGITERLWILAVSSEIMSLSMRDNTDGPKPHESLVSLVKHLRDDKGDFDVVRFRELIRELRSYSLIQEPFKGTFSIHPLIHSCARERMDPSYRVIAQHNAMHVLYCSIPWLYVEMEADFSFMRMLLPHLDSCGPPTDANYAKSFSKVFYAYGRWKDAEKMCLVMLEQMRSLPLEHPDSLCGWMSLGHAYWRQDRHSEAAEIYERVLKVRILVLGRDHLGTVDSMHSLGVAYNGQGRFDDAEKLFVQAIEVRKRIMGDDHVLTNLSMYELAGTYLYRGRLDRAEQQFLKVVEVLKRIRGDEHPYTLASIRKLAVTYKRQGRLNDAIELFVKLVDTEKRVFGDDHFITLSTMDSLAVTYQDQGCANSAQELLTAVLEARERILGPEHHDTLGSMHDLAWVYQNQGHWSNAKGLLAEVVKTCKRVLGARHSGTLKSMYDLALMNRDQGHLHDAKELFVKVMEASKSALGDDHPNTLTSTYQLALTYQAQGCLADAEGLCVELYEHNKRIYGLTDHRTLPSKQLLIDIYSQQGRPEDAEALRNTDDH